MLIDRDPSSHLLRVVFRFHVPLKRVFASKSLTVAASIASEVSVATVHRCSVTFGVTFPAELHFTLVAFPRAFLPFPFPMPLLLFPQSHHSVARGWRGVFMLHLVRFHREIRATSNVLALPIPLRICVTNLVWHFIEWQGFRGCGDEALASGAELLIARIVCFIVRIRVESLLEILGVSQEVLLCGQ